MDELIRETIEEHKDELDRLEAYDRGEIDIDTSEIERAILKNTKVPDYVEAGLGAIHEELRRFLMRETPFDNIAEVFENDVFKVESYSWTDETQPYNFKWKDFEVRWYKYFGRGMEMNRDMNPFETAQMISECIKSLIQLKEKDELPTMQVSDV